MYDWTWLKQSRQPLWPVECVFGEWREGIRGIRGRGDKVWLSMLLLVMVIGGRYGQ